MSTVVLDMAMTLDGFAAGPNHEFDGLHDWFFASSHQDSEVAKASVKGTGAIIMGRRAYDIGEEVGGYIDSPYAVPTFVVTHSAPETAASGTQTFTFVTDGVESAVEQAKASANGKLVAINGGADIAQQCLKAGLVDEIYIHLVPLMFGKGIRLFDDFPIRLELLNTISGPAATHLHYRVLGSYRR